jgi:hypothetical protein
MTIENVKTIPLGIWFNDNLPIYINYNNSNFKMSVSLNIKIETFDTTDSNVVKIYFNSSNPIYPYLNNLNQQIQPKEIEYIVLGYYQKKDNIISFNSNQEITFKKSNNTTKSLLLNLNGSIKFLSKNNFSLGFNANINDPVLNVSSQGIFIQVNQPF